MFFRRKSVGGRNYLQIVESRRTDGAVRQHVVATLGRAEDWREAGKLDQLLRSGARLSETALVLSAVRDGEGLAVDSRRIGAPLIFARLWRETGCRAVIEALLAERKFEARDLRQRSAPAVSFGVRQQLRPVARRLPAHRSQRHRPAPSVPGDRLAR